ncbi:MAG TPA: ABC transporter ATP-binding protein [Devosiaceae bacterium]|jgi:branched-chain amino acid transport system ATP-binding protein|nr:ABC transporter ATP-binding protein [Devosiaceae bacterium]
MPGDEPILVAEGLHKQYGALVVLDDVRLDIAHGQTLGIVGPNGAGKTTLLSVLSGAQAPNAGSIRFKGGDVTGLSAASRCRLGLARTHQIPRPFAGMSVFENVFVAASQAGAVAQAEAYDIAVDSLTLCGMLRLGNRPAETLGLLDRKRLELARAVATRPALLLLDEIGGGLTDAEATELVAAIRELRRRAISIVWIEHIVHVLLEVAERLICMDAGRIIADGEPQAVLGNAEVIAAYLGGAPA